MDWGITTEFWRDAAAFLTPGATSGEGLSALSALHWALIVFGALALAALAYFVWRFVQIRRLKAAIADLCAALDKHGAGKMIEETLRGRLCAAAHALASPPFSSFWGFGARIGALRSFEKSLIKADVPLKLRKLIKQFSNRSEKLRGNAGRLAAQLPSLYLHEGALREADGIGLHYWALEVAKESARLKVDPKRADEICAQTRNILRFSVAAELRGSADNLRGQLKDRAEKYQDAFKSARPIALNAYKRREWPSAPVGNTTVYYGPRTEEHIPFSQDYLLCLAEDLSALTEQTWRAGYLEARDLYRRAAELSPNTRYQFEKPKGTGRKAVERICRLQTGDACLHWARMEAAQGNIALAMSLLKTAYEALEEASPDFSNKDAAIAAAAIALWQAAFLFEDGVMRGLTDSALVTRIKTALASADEAVEHARSLDPGFESTGFLETVRASLFICPRLFIDISAQKGAIGAAKDDVRQNAIETLLGLPSDPPVAQESVPDLALPGREAKITALRAWAVFEAGTKILGARDPHIESIPSLSEARRDAAQCLTDLGYIPWALNQTAWQALFAMLRGWALRGMGAPERRNLAARDFTNAISLLRALSGETGISRVRDIIWTLRMAGRTHRALGDLSKARSMMERAIALAAEDPDPSDRIIDLIDLSLIDWLDHDYDRAKDLIKEAVDSSNAMHDRLKLQIDQLRQRLVESFNAERFEQTQGIVQEYRGSDREAIPYLKTARDLFASEQNELYQFVAEQIEIIISVHYARFQRSP